MRSAPPSRSTPSIRSAARTRCTRRKRNCLGSPRRKARRSDIGPALSLPPYATLQAGGGRGVRVSRGKRGTHTRAELEKLQDEAGASPDRCPDAGDGERIRIALGRAERLEADGHGDIRRSPIASDDRADAQESGSRRAWTGRVRPEGIERHERND